MIDLRTTTFCYPKCVGLFHGLKAFVMNDHGITPLEFKILITLVPAVLGPIVFWFLGQRLGWIGDKVPKELRSK